MRSVPIAAITVCLLIGLGSGCALFTRETTRATAEKSPLKNLRPAVDAIQLDVAFVERPVGDPILGNLLWSNLDQVSTLNASTVAALERNGIRFGVASTDPPRALQTALGMTGDVVPRTDSQQYQFTGRTYARRSGEEISINAWSGYDRCEIVVDRGGKQETLNYNNARCVFRVKVERMQDGWAKLEFIPEIHHGEMKLRNVPTENNWTTTSSQLVDPQFEQRFEVELNLGEMVVLGADGPEASSLGHHFFRGGNTDSRLQRLLIIRLADMQRVDPIYD